MKISVKRLLLLSVIRRSCDVGNEWNGFDWGKPENANRKVEYKYIIKSKILMIFYWVDVDKGTASNPDTTKHIICLLCIMFVLTTDYTFLKCN